MQLAPVDEPDDDDGGGGAGGGGGGEAPPSGTPPANPPGDKLDAVAAWVAGGFVLASGLLTYLGVKDDRLNSIFREQPRGALFVFVMIGLGVVGGVIAPAIGKETRVRLGLVFAIGAAALLVAPLWLPRLGDGDTAGSLNSVGWVLAVLVSIVLTFLLFPLTTTLKIGTVAVSLLLFGLGMYGAVKLSVDSTAAKDRPRLTASVDQTGTVPVLTITTKAAGLRTNEHISVVVWGYGTRMTNRTIEFAPCNPTTCLLLRGQRIGADGKGAVDDSFDLPLSTGDFARIQVRAFLCGPNKAAKATDDQGQVDEDPCTTVTDKVGYIDLRLPAPPDRPALSYAWSDVDPTGGVLTLATTAGGLGGDDYIALQVFTSDEGGAWTRVAYAESAPAANGTGTASVPVRLSTSSKVCALATVVADDTVKVPDSCAKGPNTAQIQLPWPDATGKNG